jgi:hypothetical protein
MACVKSSDVCFLREHSILSWGHYSSWNTSYFSVTNIYSHFVRIHDCAYRLRNFSIPYKKIYLQINRISNNNKNNNWNNAAAHALETQFIFEHEWRLLLDIAITNRPFSGPNLGHRYSNLVCRTCFPVLQPTCERYLQLRVFKSAEYSLSDYPQNLTFITQNSFVLCAYCSSLQYHGRAILQSTRLRDICYSL